MLINDALEWFRANGGDLCGFEALQARAVFLKSPSPEDDIPHPMLIGPAAIHCRKLLGDDPAAYHTQLRGPWRSYARDAMVKLRRIAETRRPEVGVSDFPSGLPGVAPFRYRWATLPCRAGGRPLIITVSEEITLH